MIIGLSGWSGSGKNTIANRDLPTFKQLSFAQPVKDALVALDPTVYIHGSHISLKKAVERDGWDYIKQYKEVRQLLQNMGTSVGRDMFGNNFWVELAMSKVNKDEDIVFTDVRFKNEADAIRKRGGQIWRIIRKGIVPMDHISEHELDDEYFDVIIYNE